MTLKPPFTPSDPVLQSVGLVPLQGAKGDGTDDYTAFRSTINGMAEGETLWVPPLPLGQFYGLAQELVVDKHINVLGSVGKLKSAPNVYYGSLIRPTSSGAQSGMASCIQLNVSSAEIQGIAFQGQSTSSSSAVKFGTNSHGSGVHRVFGEGFQSGVIFGSGSNHNTVSRSGFTGNNDGARFAAGNQFDYAFIDSLIEGNTRASVFLEVDTGVQNVLFLRTHLGFSQYGLLQDTATSTFNSFTGITMIGSPIESVSVQHINCKDGCGGWFVDRSSYWGWNGTPANAAVATGAVTYGPIDLQPNLLANTTNANSPAVISVSGFSNYPIKVDTPLNGFAQKYIAGSTLYTAASAANLNIPAGTPVASVTGTTTVTSMTATYTGDRRTLIFSGALTFTDGSNLKLAGNFVTTGDDTISLVCDGTNWVETARSVN